MLDTTTYTAISIEHRDDGVVIATLDRPERHNAVTPAMHRELIRLPHDVADDPTARVLILTGAGKSFCAGGDFGGDGEPAPTRDQTMREARQIIDAILNCPKPIIAAVKGYAMGLGANIALLSDIVFAGRSAVFADTHVRLGIGAGDGGQVIWPFLIGVNRAKYYLMTGDRVGADAALELGLVNFVVDDDDLLSSAVALAERLAKGPGLAIAASKAGVNNFLRTVSATVTPLALGLEELTMLSDDHAEAVQAFRDKREPEFRGR